MLPELWGGMECTINRVEDRYRDQLDMADHYQRTDDWKAISSLGIKKIRFPILWEKHQPDHNGDIDWNWADRSLQSLRQLGVVPIVGLVHHGSGPLSTQLDDPRWPELLADHAERVIKRHPWLEYFTPVNEPLTTARFSGLYGFWFPHKKNELSFFQMLLNQLKGTVLSMQRIRKMNPSAKLVQTEDLTQVHATAPLAYQANFENHRRWLTYDILSGRLTKGHFFYDYLLRLGIKKNELNFFSKNSCPPDIMGFNYYITSERFLDHQYENYPDWTIGGNGKDIYADTEAVQTGHVSGLSFLLKQAWDRYHIPLAVTECHLSCTREEQMRWFSQCWQDAIELVRGGVDVKALTAWSLMGAYDWNSLLTEDNRHYEPGAFDLRADKPRITALGKLIRSISQQEDHSHPLLSEAGWWEKKNTNWKRKHNSKPSPVLIIGKNGTLAAAFARICDLRSIPFIAKSREELNILDPKDLQKVIDETKPWAIINTSGYVNVDAAEQDREKCFDINAKAPGLLADISKQKGIRFLSFSSDLVFNGEKQDAYHERDSVQPLNVYGESKAKGEKNILYSYPGSLIIRSSAFFGPWDRYNFIYQVMTALQEKRKMSVANDVTISPTYVPDLVNTALDLFIDEEDGVWHLSNEGSLSWADLAMEVAARTDNNSSIIEGVSSEQMEWVAARPRYSVLKSEKGAKLSGLESALDRYFKECIV